MKLKFLLFALVLSEERNAELQKRIEGFERITSSLSNEVDKQSKEIKALKQNRYKKSSSLQLAA
jgi:cell division septum initiation protein DivIVA